MTERSALTPGRHVLFLNQAGRDRRFTVYIPPLHNARLPLVVVLHGAGSSGSVSIEKNGWIDKSESAGFVVAAPDGIPLYPDLPMSFEKNPRVWNTGHLPVSVARAQIDDVAFVQMMLDNLHQRLPIDESHIFAVGHSNGGAMVFMLGTELSQRFAALAIVAGHCWKKDPRPAQPRPTLYMVGDQDPLVPIQGGKVLFPWGEPRIQPSVENTLKTWALALGISDESPIHKSVSDEVTICRRGSGESLLVSYIVANQGHGWPGGAEVPLPPEFLGPKCETFRATDAIWDFFNDHAPIEK